MLYTLDSNAVTAVLREDTRVKNRLKQVRLSRIDVMLNAISYFEVRRGLALPRFQRKRHVFDLLTKARGVLPLDTPALDCAADIYQELRAAGTPLEDADILIAGIALANDATVVTRNARHFERIRGLRLENWEN